MSISQAEEILWLTWEYTRAFLKKSHKRLIGKFHPDRNPWNKEAGEMSKKINLAYELLLKQFN